MIHTGYNSAAMPRVVLISTYDLGRQPFGLASPAAWLKRAGAEVRCLDLAVEPFDEIAVHDADLVALFLPMHTATRLGAKALERVKALNPRAHLCGYGLYAPMNEAFLHGLGVHTVLGGEYESGLVKLAEALRAAPGVPSRAPESKALAGRRGAKAGATVVPSTPCHIDAPSRSHEAMPTISLERQEFLVPDRSGIPALSAYARLVDGQGTPRLVGYTEASRGCKHLCRHCPVVPVYQGRFRIVQREVVQADIRQQVAVGAEHITFGDPDFFNGVGHAIPVVKALHQEFPKLTYDVTIKIEHLLKHAAHLATLRETGCLFVTSAVESIDDRVLQCLDKGHTRADFLRVVQLCRDAELTLHPTFVTFTPWTSLGGYQQLLTQLEAMDLVEQVAPIQLAIRLLIPAGSKLLELAEVRSLVQPFDSVALVYPWRHPDPQVDELHARVHAMVRDGITQGLEQREVFSRVWELGERAGGGDHRAPQSASRLPAMRDARRPPIPYLTEPWYC